MNKVNDYKAAGFLQDSPYGDDEMLFIIPIRIAKATIEAGGFEIAASGYGWKPEDGIPAPQRCINEVKQFSGRAFFEALSKKNREDAEALTLQQAAAMI